MNIAVCDDQPEVLDVVENMLREIPEVERVETYAVHNAGNNIITMKALGV